jgi:hypothetical protein
VLHDHRRQVEHLEDPLEADQRGHHVDAHVGQALERAEQPQQQGGEGQERADGERPLDGERAADAVDEGGGQGRDQHQRRAEHPGDHRDPHAEVAHQAGLLREVDVLLVAPAEQLEQHRAADVEPLGHRVAQVGVALHLLTGQAGEPVADPA